MVTANRARGFPLDCIRSSLPFLVETRSKDNGLGGQLTRVWIRGKIRVAITVASNAMIQDTALLGLAHAPQTDLTRSIERACPMAHFRSTSHWESDR